MGGRASAKLTATAATATCSNSNELVAEHARRMVAQILLSLSIGTDDFQVLVILGELLLLVIIRTLRLAGIRANQGHRSHINIFDLIQSTVLSRVKIARIHQLLEWARNSNINSNINSNNSSNTIAHSQLGGTSSRSPKLKPPIFLPNGRSMLRMASDRPYSSASSSPIGLNSPGESLDITGASSIPRPIYILDIYPPFPRPYTFRRTETRGVRESDRVVIAKSKAEQQRQVETNLFRFMQRTQLLPSVVSFEDIPTLSIHEPQ